jgi:hypothetical protein
MSTARESMAYSVCVSPEGNGMEELNLKGKYEGARDGSCRRKFAVEDA